MLHLKTRRTGIAALAYSPCGRWLAAAGTDGVHVWDLADPAAAPAHVAGEDRFDLADGAVFFPDGRLYFRNRHGYYVYDLAAGDVAAFPTRSFAFASPDGRRVAYHGDNDRPAVYALAPDGSAAPAWEVARLSYLQVAAFSLDGTAVAFAVAAYRRRYPDQVGSFLTVHAADTGAVVHDLKAVYAETAQLLFAPDGNTLVAGSGKGLAVYDLTAPAKKPKKAANPDPSHFRAAAYSPCGRRFATVSSDRVVRLWDTATWTPAAAYTWDIGKLTTVAFSPDGSTAATASSGGRVVVWDIDG